MAEDVRSIWSTLERLVVIFGMLGLAFTAGQNWHRIDAGEARDADLYKQQEAIRADYMRKDVLAEQMKNFENKLDEVIRVQREQVRPVPPTPQFGRK